jgi:hypothetical protein
MAEWMSVGEENENYSVVQERDHLLGSKLAASEIAQGVGTGNQKLPAYSCDNF